MLPDLPLGTVTMGDLYRELVGMRSDIAKALTRIEVIDTRNVDADRIHSDFEARLRILEKFRYTLAGIAVVGGACAGWAGYLLGHFLH